MTIIAAWYDAEHRRAAIGADSLSYDGAVKFACFKKVRRIGPAAIGFAGTVAWDRFLDEASCGAGDFDGYALACWVADTWREWAKAREHGSESDGMRALPGGMLVATCDGIYGLTSDGGVVCHGRYAAIGAGQAVAYGALYAIDRYRWVTLPVEIVAEAVRAAIEHADGCGGVPLVLRVGDP